MTGLSDRLWNLCSRCAKSAMPEIDDLDRNVIWIKKNAQIPTIAPWVSLDIKSVEIVGTKQSQTPLPIDISETITVNSVYSIAVNIYGNEAYEKATMFIAAMKESNTMDVLYQNALSYVGVSIINDLSTVVDSVWEGRSNFTIRVMGSTSKQSTVRQIVTVPVRGVVDDEFEVSLDVNLTS